MPLFAPNVEALKKRRDARALIRLLETHRAPDVRLAAAQALGEIGAPEAVDPLLRALGATDDRLRRAAIVALARIGDRRAVDPFIALLADPQACAYAIRGLVTLRANRAADALLAVRDADPQNRRLAIQALVALNEPRAIQPLTQSGNLSPDLVRATADALLDLGPRAIPALLPALNTPQPPQAAIDVLAAMGEPAVEPLLQATREGPDPIRSAAARALARIGEPALGPLIEELGRSLGLSRRNEMAARALGQMGDPRAVEPLGQALRTADRTNRLFRRELIAALGQIGSDQALPAFRLALRDEDPDLRQAAVRALAEYGRTQAAALLRDALQDADPGVRAAAARALGRLGDATAVEGLGQKLLDANPDTARAAARALADIGGPQAAAQLSAALSSPRCLIRTQIAAALLSDGSAPALRALSALERETDVHLRGMALQARARLEGAAAIPALIAALQDASADVRSTAAGALDDLGWKPDRDDLQARYLVARQQWAETTALGAAAIEALEHVLPDERVRAQAGAALEKLAWQPTARDAAAAGFWIERRQWDRCVEIGPPAVEPLIQVLGHADLTIRPHVIRALGQIGGDRAAQGLAGLLDDPGQDKQARLEAVRALGQIGGEKAGQALMAALEQRDSPQIGLEIVETLSGFNLPALDAPILSALLGLVDHPNPDVQRAARQAAGARCKPQALPILLQALGHPRWPVRRYVAQALIDLYRSGQLEPTALDVVRAQRAQIAAAHIDWGQDLPHEDANRTVEGWCIAHVDEAAQTHTDTGIGLSFDL